MSNWVKKIVRFKTILVIASVTTIVSLFFAYLSPYVHPDTVEIIPFFGLVYPVIIIVALILGIIWAIKKSRWAFVMLGAIILGGNLHFRTLALGSEDEIPANANVFKVMSYNVRLFDVYNQNLDEAKANRDSIIRYIVNENPDIVCFQEFYHQDKPTRFVTRDTLTKLLGTKYTHERYSHKRINRQNFGICMLSKYEMIAQGDVMFENFASTDNYCIYADIVKGKDTIRVYNIHLQSIKLQQQDYALFGENNKQSGDQKSTARLLFEKLTIAYPARAEQARRVVEHMETSPYPVVVCGDFNDTPMSYVYNQFNKTLIDSYRESCFGLGVTYVGKVPAGRIDYIFHSPNLASSKFKIQERAFSDHRAIQCQLWKSVAE